jgi:hypothetical protein
VEKIRGFPPPITDLVSDRRIMRILERIHAFFSRIFPNLFAYNFLVVATRMDGISDILDRTIRQDRVFQARAGDLEREKKFFGESTAVRTGSDE